MHHPAAEGPYGSCFRLENAANSFDKHTLYLVFLKLDLVIPAMQHVMQIEVIHLFPAVDQTDLLNLDAFFLLLVSVPLMELKVQT